MYERNPFQTALGKTFTSTRVGVYVPATSTDMRPVLIPAKYLANAQEEDLAYLVSRVFQQADNMREPFISHEMEGRPDRMVLEWLFYTLGWAKAQQCLDEIDERGLPSPSTDLLELVGQYLFN